MMNNPFDYTPDAACEEAFQELTARIERLRSSDRPEDVSFCREIDAGKMLGVLIAVDHGGMRHTLYAFSGQLGVSGFRYPGFVEPVFDYLQPDGYFKRKEKEITLQNIEIEQFEKGFLSEARADYNRAKEQMETEVQAFKERCRLSKAERAAKREAGVVGEAELAAMIRQSQYEKAELHRLKRRLTDHLKPLADKLQEAEARLESFREKRRNDSESLQQWLFTNFRMLNARGECRSLSEIFADTPMKIPPSGAGECCAPKLLQGAYLRGWTPVAMAEYWYGKPKGGEVRVHGKHYPACRGKCLPVVGWMLQGLAVKPPLGDEIFTAVASEPEIVYENRWFCVVNKPAGMLSVPGKGAHISVQQWLTRRYGREVKVAHRLDQDTSGLLIATMDDEAFKVMQKLFATREVRKTYIADLTGDYRSAGIPRHGRIELPLSPDWLDRPRQRVAFEGGKEAVTEYEFTGTSDGRSRILFHPLTGRTHQLRVHSASGLGLNMPIAGDRLYGKNSGNYRERLHLHAQKIEFTFPLDGQRYCFESEVPF